MFTYRVSMAFDRLSIGWSASGGFTAKQVSHPVAQLWLAAIAAPPKGSNRAAAIVGGTRPHKRKVPIGAPSHDARPSAGSFDHTCRTQ
jgi:hypothetical protein